MILVVNEFSKVKFITFSSVEYNQRSNYVIKQFPLYKSVLALLINLSLRKPITTEILGNLEYHSELEIKEYSWKLTP